MNELQIFQYHDKEIRAVQQNGEPWFVLRDVCQVLDLTTPARVAERLDQDEVSLTHITDSLGRQQETTIISESGLYAVILRSDKPEAKPFRKFVTSEVLPSIRKTGSYTSGQAAELVDRVAALEAANRELMAALGWVPPISTWSQTELSRMMASALKLGREDFITVLYLGYYVGLAPGECFAMETATAARAAKEGVLRLRGRGNVPLSPVVTQRILRHLRLDNPGKRLLLPDRKRLSTAVESFQVFLRAFWPAAQDQTPLAARTNAPCPLWASPVG